MDKARLRWQEMLPVVMRELRVASKRPFTYRLRWGMALATAVAMIIGSLILPGASLAYGRVMFWFTASMMLLVCAGAGLLLTADSLSREKREGTLGLLFLTRLGGADIVLGKLAAAVVTGGSVAIAAMPFLAFSLCLGGIMARELMLMGFLLVLLLAYSLALGICISTFFRREGVVSALFCVIMFLPAAALPFVYLRWGTIPELCGLVNPFFPALVVMDLDRNILPREFVRKAVFCQGLMTAALVMLSSVSLPWLARARTSFARARSFEALAKLRRVERRGLLESDPVLWLSQRQNHPLTLLFLCVGMWFAAGFAAKNAFVGEVIFVLTLAILPKWFVLWQSSGMMADERQSGFLEALLTTPITAGEALRGKARAIKRQVAPALVFALVVQWATSTKWWGQEGAIPISSTLLFAAMLTLLVDVHTIVWVGMWQGLAARDRRRALVRALLWGFIAPWIPGLLLGGIVSLLFEPMWMSSPDEWVAPSLIFSNVASFGIGCFAMARLHEKFRATAARAWTLKTAH